MDDVRVFQRGDVNSCPIELLLDSLVGSIVVRSVVRLAACSETFWFDFMSKTVTLLNTGLSSLEALARCKLSWCTAGCHDGP